MPDPRGFVEVPKDRFPQEDIQVGMMVSSKGAEGQPVRAVIKEIQTDIIVLDFNHPLAGKILHFDVEIIEVV